MVRIAGSALGLLAMMLVALGGAARAAEYAPFIRLSVADQAVFLGDTIVLQIEYSGLEETLDVSALAAAGRLGRRTVGTHIAVIGGQVVDIRSLRIEITPESLGRVTLGPLEAGGVTSNLIVLQVAEARAVDWHAGADDLRVTATLEPADPVVHEQLTYDLVLKHRHPLSKERIELPAFDGFDVIPVFEARRTLDGEGRWRQIAWRYLLFPVRSGPLAIQPARFGGTITKSRLEQNSYDIAAQGFDLEVGPAESASSWWLPARSVSMGDEWSTDPRTLSAGDEIERTIVVSAENVMARQIPQIVMPAARGLRITPLGVERTMRVTERGMLAEARFRFRIRATSPVPVFLDTIRLPWWNTATRTGEEAIIPARRIDIGAADMEKLVAEARRTRSLADRLLDDLPRGLNAALVLVCLALLATLAFGMATPVAVRRLLHRWRLGRRLRRSVVIGDPRSVALFIRAHLGKFADRDKALDTARAIEKALYGRGSNPELKAAMRNAARLDIRPPKFSSAMTPALPSL